MSRILGRFARVTSSGSFIPEVDGLRFVAIASVFVFHGAIYVLSKTGQPLDRAGLLRYGCLGVQLFFAISGFILALPFAASYLEGKPRPNLRSYYLRRVTRIEPPYVLNLCLCAGLLLCMGRTPGLLSHLLASLTYTHNLLYSAPSTINVVAWSLEVEVQFYILAPLLFTLFGCAAWKRRAAFLLIAAAGIAAASTSTEGDPRRLPLLGCVQFFVIGAFLADVYVGTWRRRPVRSLRWDLLAVAAWTLMAVCVSYEAGRLLVFPVTILAAYLSVFRGVVTNAVFRNPLLTTIGGMCYTIYLYHYLMISFLGSFTLRLGTSIALQVVVLGVIISLCCAVLFLLTEQPFMRKDWPQRLLGALRRREAPSRLERAA